MGILLEARAGLEPAPTPRGVCAAVTPAGARGQLVSKGLLTAAGKKQRGATYGCAPNVTHAGVSDVSRAATGTISSSYESSAPPTNSSVVSAVCSSGSFMARSNSLRNPRCQAVVVSQ